MTDIHAPTPEFRDYLEADVVHRFRRDRAFARYRALAVVVSALAIGVTAGLAPAQIREGAQRDSLLESATAELQLVALRQQLAHSQLADVTKKVQAGAFAPDALAAAQADARRMDAAAMRAQLNVEEIRATALPPRDDLNAPLVNGRDFVSQRIMTEMVDAEQRLRAAEATREEARRRAAVGASTELPVLDAELEVVRAQAALGVLVRRQALRREFLDRATPGDALQHRLHEEQMRLEAMVAQHAVKAAKARVVLVARQRAVGAAGELEQLRAELQLKEAETELMLLARQLRRSNP